tara:strand:+ start:1024 stop:2115 length:1092 start_codon:yes stop_codon:yes gene_type:complete
MDIGKAIYKILHDNIAVESMVGTRIAPNVMKQTSPFPFIVYDVTSDDPEGQKESVALLDTATIMVSTYCKTYAEASKLANYIRTALDRVNGVYNAVNIQSINFDGYDDVFDDMSGSDGIYRKSLNFNVRIINSFNNIYSTAFDGVDDYVDIDSSGSAINTVEGSFSLWAKVGTMASSAYFINYRVDTNNQIQIFYHASSNEVRINYKAGGTSALAVFTDAIENDGLWHHIVGTWDVSGDEVKIYLDGTLKQTTNSLGTFVGTPAYASIGSSGVGSSYYTGSIDEVSLFNVELTASQVTNLYNDGLPYTVAADTGLIGWWRMGDGGITGNPIAIFPTIPDDSSNSNNGEMTNMTSTDFQADVPE